MLNKLIAKENLLRDIKLQYNTLDSAIKKLIDLKQNLHCEFDKAIDELEIGVRLLTKRLPNPASYEVINILRNYSKTFSPEYIENRVKEEFLNLEDAWQEIYYHLEAEL